MRAVATVCLAALLLCLAGAAENRVLGQIFGGGRRPIVRANTRTTAKYDQHPLVKVVREQQSRHVRESWGTEDWQCFTDDDLRQFKADDVVGQVTAELKRDAEFLAVVEQIRQMSAGERDQLLRQASKTFKPTWAQNNGISRAGQTVAGQTAERMLAEGITNLVRQLLKTP